MSFRSIAATIVVSTGIWFPWLSAQTIPATEHESPHLTVPMEIQRQKMYVRLNTSAGELKMLVDTGTEQTEVFHTALRHVSVALHPLRTRMFGIGNSNRVVTIGEMALTIQLPPWKPYQTEALLSDPLRTDRDPYDGILGLDFFRTYCVELDRAAAQMRIFAVSDCGAKMDARVKVPVNWTRHDILVPVQVRIGPSGKEIHSDAILDTGANLSLLLTDRFRKHAGLEPHPRNAPSVETVGTNGMVYADVVQGARYRLGNSPILIATQIAVARGNLHPKTGLFAGQSLRFDAVLGNAVLSLVTLRFDPQQRCLYVKIPKT